MQEVQIRKNAVGAIIHNDIKNYPYLNIPMVIKKKDGQIYEVINTGFHNGRFCNNQSKCTDCNCKKQ